MRASLNGLVAGAAGGLGVFLWVSYYRLGALPVAMMLLGCLQSVCAGVFAGIVLDRLKETHK